MIHVNSAGFCDDQLPLLSTIGRGPAGPQGPKGDDGDVGTPTFADPIEWSPASDYAKFTVVLHDGNSYTSIRDVVAGTDINNEDYWALSGNYDAQVEELRQEVEQMSANISFDKSSYHTLGQIVFDTAATSGSPIMYLCTASGTPGTLVGLLNR